MKKTLLLIMVVLILPIKTYSQDKLLNYLQGNVGIGFEDARYLKLEVGRKVSIFDLGIGFSYSSNMPLNRTQASVRIDEREGNRTMTAYDKEFFGKQFFSCMINAKINILELITKQDKHQLYFGGAFGVISGSKVLKYFGDEKTTLEVERYLDSDYTLNLSYLYQLNDKYALGIITEMMPLPEFFTVGISVKRSF